MKPTISQACSTIRQTAILTPLSSLKPSPRARATWARKSFASARDRRHPAGDKSWIVHTEKGDIAADYVVNAAGYYAQRVGEWFKPYGGRTVPMMVMEHQYLLTEQIPEVVHGPKNTAKSFPSSAM